MPRECMHAVRAALVYKALGDDPTAVAHALDLGVEDR